MIIQPKVRGFVCTTAHPVGCETNVKEQIDYVAHQASITGPKNVLVIGASTGYGLASRIVALTACDANTLGIFFEKEAKGKRTASAGWYNSAAFEKLANEQGKSAISLNGDAFSDEIKLEAIKLIKENYGKVDLVVYSLAAPRRIDPVTGEKYGSVLKPIGESYTNKNIDVMSKTIDMATIEPANDQEIEDTVKVMGGEDWARWIDFLMEAEVLSEGAKSVAYSYIGPEVTKAIYREGTIGKAKEHLEKTAKLITEKLQDVKGHGYVVVAKALVTQASAAIPIVPLYIASLYKTMKEMGNHEGCIEQIYRLFNDHLYSENGPSLDELSRIRIDDLEMLPEVQEKALSVFDIVNSDNLDETMNISDYQREFYRLFGFDYDGVDYEADVEVDVKIPSIDL